MTDVATTAVPSAIRDIERERKRSRVLDILDANGSDAVLLRSAAAVNWYLAGARTHVSLAADPIVAVRVTHDTDEIHVTDNEADRLLDEELPSDSTLIRRPWHRPLPVEGTLEEAAIDAQLRAARRALLPTEVDRYRALCVEAATILTDVLLAADPDDLELDLAADITARVVRAGADALVVLVGGEERSGYRHPLPTDARIGRRVMVVLCARRHGLIANVTRIVRFGAASLQDRRRERSILEVEADVFEALVPGRTLAAVLETAASSYPRRGFAADEWTRHHQGGAAGYAGRDPRATPDSRDTVVFDQAFAWNPSAYRAKVEDTVVVTAAGIDVLSLDGRWPTLDVRGRARPDVLVR